ncbi:DUF305 domain-containing protein [Nonomuraea sp. NPDC000554]|uniref:DUF305 domain-containing protein n=1 Tax=Nonomuraea sp. NPDC000554 TaxID=3154259 RepID=UPI00331AC167
MGTTRLRKLALAGLATGALALLTACGGSADSTSGHDMSTTKSSSSQPSSATFNDADVVFAQMMIPHHQQAVEMADLAATRASDKEIKDLAAKIKAAQDPEIQTMRGWLKSWGKEEPSGGMGHSMPGIMSEEEMKKLEAAKGAAFDKQFAQLMIAHHNGAIDMARTEQAQGSNAEAKDLAKAIETGQQAEVQQMQDLLKRL